MNKSLRSFLYEIKRSILETYWALSGGQRQRAFLQSCNFNPHTVFTSHRRMKLPKGDCRSDLVLYSDFVQLHSCCRWVEQLEKPVIVDVGAYHGVYAIILGLMAQRRNGKVLAIEPNFSSYEILKNNVERNRLQDTVVCERLAITDRPGMVGLVSHGSTSRISHQSMNNRIKGERLSSLLEKHSIRLVDLLVIDVEGAELAVLRSISWERVSIKRIFCELHPYNWKHFGYGAKDFQAFLRGHNYRCYDMYFNEHRDFNQERYIGPTIFMQTS